MSFALLAHNLVTASTSTVTSSAIDSTGAGLIYVAVSYHHATQGGSVADSAGNTYTLALSRFDTNANWIDVYYCLNPINSGSLTATFTQPASGANADIMISAFSGTAQFDQTASNASSATTSIQPGSITPPANNGLVLSTGAWRNGPLGSLTGMTLLDSSGSGSAYSIQTTAAAINPTWTVSTSAFMASTSISFLPAASTSKMTGVASITGISAVTF